MDFNKGSRINSGVFRVAPEHRVGRLRRSSLRVFKVTADPGSGARAGLPVHPSVTIVIPQASHQVASLPRSTTHRHLINNQPQINKIPSPAVCERFNHDQGRVSHLNARLRFTSSNTTHTHSYYANGVHHAKATAAPHTAARHTRANGLNIKSVFTPNCGRVCVRV